MRNWAGNVLFTVDDVARPGSVGELQEVVAGARRVRALGTAHSFNRLADTDGVLVSVAGLPPEVEVAADRHSATVAAGMRLGELAVRLDAEGVALTSLPSLPHISLAGACATATHGSGEGVRCLAASVRAVEFVAAGGELRRLARGDECFPGAVVALGCLGVVTRMEVDVVPAAIYRQDIYEGLAFADLVANLGEVMTSADSVSVMTRWETDRVHQVWRKRRTDPGDTGPAPARWRGATLADGPRHPVTGQLGTNSTPLGVPGPWHERLPHFRMDATPSVGQELQSEWLLPLTAAAEALARVAALRAHLDPVLQVSELRTVAADDLWLSPASGRDSLAVHCTWTDDAERVAAVVPLVDRALVPLGAAPHWGKVFTTERAALRARYPRWDDFQRLADDLDPQGVFRNPFTARLFPPPA